MTAMNPHYDNLGKDTPTKKRLMANLFKHDPELNEKDILKLLGSIKRFVNVVKKLRTEPQANIIYKEGMFNGRTEKDRIIQTDIEELGKVIIDQPSYPIKEALDRLATYFPEKKNGRRRKKK